MAASRGRRRNPGAEKVSAVQTLVVPVSAGTPIWTPRRYDRLADEGYVRNVIGYRCVRLVAINVARLPWIARINGEEVDDHPILQLMKRPNPMQGGVRFWTACVSFHRTSGNMYIEAVRPGSPEDRPQVPGFPPSELWPLRSDRIQIIAGETGLPMAYRYNGAMAYKDFVFDQITMRSNVLHVRDWHPLDDFYGLSPLEPAAMSIDQHNAASTHNAALLKQGIAPPGAFTFKQPMTPEQIEYARNTIMQRMGGARGAGVPLVLGGEWDFKPYVSSNKDMEWSVGMLMQARNICQALEVPHVLVVEGESTYANREMATLELYEGTVIPHGEMLRDELNNWLGPMYGDGVELDFDKDQIPALAPRRKVFSDMILAQVTANLITQNEGREALQWEPIDGGDKTNQQLAHDNAIAQIDAQPKPLAALPGPPVRDPRQPQRLLPPPKSVSGEGIKALYGIPGTYVAIKVDPASGKALVAWAAAMGIANIVPPGEMHCTVVASKVPVPAIQAGLGSPDYGGEAARPETFCVALMGPETDPPTPKALVLEFESWYCTWRHDEAAGLGATWDFPEYRPHVTISYDPGYVDLHKVKPPPFGILLRGEVAGSYPGDPEEKGGRRRTRRLPFAIRRGAKFNPNHDELGRFASGGGGGVSYAGLEVPGDAGPEWTASHIKDLATAVNQQASDAELAAGKSYVANYQDVGSALRKGEQLSAKHAEHVATIDKAIDGSRLPAPAVGYRAMWFYDDAERDAALGKLEVGSTFSDKAFVSTAVDRNSAERFINGPHSVLVEVRMAKGQRALPLDGLKAARGASAGGEGELLLPRDTTFRVTAIAHESIYDREEGDIYSLPRYTVEIG